MALRCGMTRHLTKLLLSPTRSRCVSAMFGEVAAGLAVALVSLAAALGSVVGAAVGREDDQRFAETDPKRLQVSRAR